MAKRSFRFGGGRLPSLLFRVARFFGQLTSLRFILASKRLGGGPLLGAGPSAMVTHALEVAIA